LSMVQRVKLSPADALLIRTAPSANAEGIHRSILRMVQGMICLREMIHPYLDRTVGKAE
jgi:hypothetical protein